MPHPALASTAHRPWPLPDRPWVLSMAWHDLLFLHWPVPAAALQAHLPPGLELETFAGSAWLGVVPFRMVRTRWRFLPPVPTAGTFDELNVRTYVRAGGRSGVWFFSLDAASRLAVEGARLGFGLPYFRARMACRVEHGNVEYRSERHDRRGPPAVFAAGWSQRGGGAVAAPGSLEQFLVERYALFAWRRGRLVCGEIAHAPWRLAPAEVRIDACDMGRILGLALPPAPVSALAAAALDVAAFAPRPAPA
ncbi:MAG: DUF2071 domain-containing protein [Planctomycetes bacterium]|nr:DUF2071 domain-containing protein [Planctomycetota bacterium]